MKVLLEESKLLELPIVSLKSSLENLKKQQTVNPSVLVYAEGLSAYLSGNVDELTNIINQLKNDFIKLSDSIEASGDEFIESSNSINFTFLGLLIKLLEMRLALRSRNLLTIEKCFEGLLNSNTTSIPLCFLGERAFLMARSQEFLLRHNKAINYYKEAAHFYDLAGLSKKKLKSLFNSMICRELLNNEINLSEYRYFLKLAIKERDRSILGIILNNFAYTLLFAGAYNSAMRLLKKSLHCLENESESLNYKMAQLNLAHLYFLLDFKTEFEHLTKKLEKSNYPEIVAGLSSLQKIPNSKKVLSMTSGWTSRLKKQLSTMEVISAQEDKLLGFLALADRDKKELMHYLWSSRLEEEVLLPRLKRIMARIKVKRPGFVTVREGKYSLSIKELSRTKLREFMPTENKKEFLSKDLYGQERRLVELLQKQSYSFFDLLTKIYDDSLYNINGSTEKFINRLKNLIARVRKKYPGRIHFRDGNYIWS